MYHWSVDFQVPRALPGFPEQGRMAMETQFSDSYFCRAGSYDGLFVYTYAGHGCFRKGKQVWDLVPGTAYIISGNADDITYYYPKGETQSWTFMWLVFKGRHAAVMMQELIARYGCIYQIRSDHPALEELRHYQHCDHPLEILPQHRATAMVFGLISALSEAFDHPTTNTTSAKFVDQVQRFIIDHLDDGIMPGTVARSFGCSREHLSRVFRAETGVTPADFILRRRLALAAHLLKETRLSVKEIATKAGYENTTNLIRAFKRQYALTPLVFRRDGTLPLM